MRNLDEKPYSADERRVAEFFAQVVGIGGGDDPIGSLLASHAYLAEERNRFRAGLQIIRASGPEYGGAWCAAQARGYLEDLDYDAYPDTGKPPR